MLGDLRLYTRVRTVSAGCMAAQTHTPLTDDAARYVHIESFFQPFRTSIDFPRLYDGNWAADPYSGLC